MQCNAHTHARRNRHIHTGCAWIDLNLQSNTQLFTHTHFYYFLAIIIIYFTLVLRHSLYLSYIIFEHCIYICLSNISLVSYYASCFNVSFLLYWIHFLFIRTLLECGRSNIYSFFAEGRKFLWGLKTPAWSDRGEESSRERRRSKSVIKQLINTQR